MRLRLARMGLVMMGVLALLGTTTSPAHATSVGGFVFAGEAVLDAPLGIVCVDGTVPPNLSKCPQTPPLIGFTKDLPLPGGLPNNGNVPYVHGGNTRGFSFSSGTACATTSVNVLKAGKPTVHTPNTGCAIGAAGTVTGWCGYVTGLGTGTATDGLGNTYNYRFHIYPIGPALYITGHWSKPNGQTGKLLAVVQAIPVPGVPTGNSCFDKTATTFTIVGAAGFGGTNL